MEDTLVYVMAGGQGERLRPLTDVRAKPAVPFGGIFRIIDFTLSNCINSGLRKIYVLTQYKSHSLSNHLKSGWSILSRRLDQFIDEVPAQQQLGGSWYQGTADAIRQNVNFVEEANPRRVLILSGDHVYKMDYRLLARFHDDGTLAVSDLSLVAASHEITVLVGSSGCGKTTLLRMVNRLVTPTSGQVLIDDVDVADRNPVELRRSIGYVMQNSGLLPHRTTVDNIATVPVLQGTPAREARQRAVDRHAEGRPRERQDRGEGRGHCRGQYGDDEELVERAAQDHGAQGGEDVVRVCFLVPAVVVRPVHPRRLRVAGELGVVLEEICDGLIVQRVQLRPFATTALALARAHQNGLGS